MPELRGALDGIKVVDCSSYLAGPYGAMMLGRYGRQRHQGRVARGRLLPRASRLLRLESRQALPRRQPQGGRRPRGAAPPRQDGRRLHAEHASRRRRAARHGLGDAARAQSAADLLRHHRLRPRRALPRPAGLRSGAPGHGRRPASAGLRRAAAVRARRRHRLLHGRPRRPGRARGALRPRAHGPRPARRDLAAPGRAGAAVGQRGGLSGQADFPARDSDLPALPGRGRPVVLPRVRQPGLLGQALQGHRPARDDRRSALRLVAPARRQSRDADADSRGGLRDQAAGRVAQDPERPRHPLRARPDRWRSSCATRASSI